LAPRSPPKASGSGRQKARQFRIQDIGWLLLAGALGGCAALGLSILYLATSSYGQTDAPQGYMNPSAAVGSSLETIYKAAAILLFGAALGMLSYAAGRWFR